VVGAGAFVVFETVESTPLVGEVGVSVGGAGAGAVGAAVGAVESVAAATPSVVEVGAAGSGTLPSLMISPQAEFLSRPPVPRKLDSKR
jgi:hypothetical protein